MGSPATETVEHLREALDAAAKKLAAAKGKRAEAHAAHEVARLSDILAGALRGTLSDARIATLLRERGL